MIRWTTDIPAPGGVIGRHTPEPPAPDEATLLKRCRGGDASALASLVCRYYRPVFRAILRGCRNPHDAEDLCQDTFVKALECLPQFRRDSGFYTWLFRIALNLIIDQRQRLQRVKFHSLDACVGGRDDHSPLGEVLAARRCVDADRDVELADTHRAAMEALLTMEESFRAVVVLRDIEGMDYRQVAEVLDIPAGTVKTRLYRARRLLRDRLLASAG